MKQGYWAKWLIGAKIIIAGIIPAIVGVLGTFLMRLAIATGKASLIALGGLINVIMFIFVTIFLLGFFANQFWKFK